MEKMILAYLFMLMSLPAFAQIPTELQNLIPAGSTNIQIHGQTKDLQKCKVQFTSEGGVFYAAIAILSEDGNIDRKGLAKFQLGFGHELNSLKQKNQVLTATSIHEAEEQYSSDSKSTLQVFQPQGLISAVQIHEQEKFLFIYTTRSKISCYLNP